jgi:hypothetical protein
MFVRILSLFKCNFYLELLFGGIEQCEEGCDNNFIFLGTQGGHLDFSATVTRGMKVVKWFFVIFVAIVFMIHLASQRPSPLKSAAHSDATGPAL